MKLNQSFLKTYVMTFSNGQQPLELPHDTNTVPLKRLSDPK